MDQQPGRNWRRGFWSLFATQFQESFSDNAYRFLMITIVTATVVAKSQQGYLLLAVTTLFSLPFILSMVGGYFADASANARSDGNKSRRNAVMAIALAGLALLCRCF
jgi:MFS family permease